MVMLHHLNGRLDNQPQYSVDFRWVELAWEVLDMVITMILWINKHGDNAVIVDSIVVLIVVWVFGAIDHCLFDC